MQRRILLTLILVALTVGCGSQVVPGVVVEGTTATIAIPVEFEVGYGRRLSGLDPEVSTPLPSYATTGAEVGLEDLQRGELVFTLYEPGTANKVAVLPVRYVARLAQDPGSARAQGLQYHEDNFQPIALVDIPFVVADDPSGNPVQQDFEIEVTRWRREGANLEFARVLQTFSPDWVGWGSVDGGPTSLQQRIPITIMDAVGTDGSEPARYTPKEAWGPYLGQIHKSYAEGNLRDAVPLPEFRIQVPDSLQTPPSAWEMTVRYPSDRIEVADVRLIRGNPAGGYVGWSANESPTSCPSPAGTLSLNVVDPDSLSRGVSVSFRFINQDVPDCQSRIGQNDLLIESYRGYDVDGVTLGQNDFDFVLFDLY